MTLQYLLDADVLSEPMKPTPDAAVLRKLREHAGTLCIPAPAWSELQFGWLRLPAGRRRDAVGAYLGEVGEGEAPILPYDRSCGEWHAGERARLEARGRTPPFVDGQIAAIAAVHDLTLVTRNRRDFQLFKGLQVVTWHSG